MYYIKIKDDIAIGISIFAPSIGFDCDRYEEVSDEVANNVEFPAILVNGEWVKTDEYPTIDYPITETEPPQPTLEERVTELEEQNEMMADVLDALLMGDL